MIHPPEACWIQNPLRGPAWILQLRLNVLSFLFLSISPSPLSLSQSPRLSSPPAQEGRGGWPSILSLVLLGVSACQRGNFASPLPWGWCTDSNTSCYNSRNLDEQLFQLTCCSVQDLGLKEYAGIHVSDAGEEQPFGLNWPTRDYHLRNT